MSSADLITRVTNGSRPLATTLTAAHVAATTTAVCGALTGWPTTPAGVHFAIYKKDTSGVKVAGSQTDWEGIVSGTSLINLVLKAGTDNGYAIGDTVECMPTAAWADGLAQGLLLEHGADGTHASALVTSRTEDTAPDVGADFLLTYDTSATALKKVKPSNLGITTGWIAGQLPAVSGNPTENGNRSADITFASTVAS
ncbi:MAG: hypothetical protein WCJ60_04115, partial [bacterium]